jgi:hypothetical protein
LRKCEIFFLFLFLQKKKMNTVFRKHRNRLLNNCSLTNHCSKLAKYRKNGLLTIPTFEFNGISTYILSLILSPNPNPNPNPNNPT